MKKLVITFSILILAACSSQTPQQDNGIYDMKTVQEYRQQVMSGNTVTPLQKAKAKEQADDPIQMHVSDARPKSMSYQRAPVAIVPSVGFGYYHHRHHW